ncbi:hypothetical protein [Microvirga alba]|uniref:Uncharacterized protein n=1 Tax=Microvirga alba TaxID=2791025 RepID=A0A931BYS7_9HYPH|nr:hypothetical protein [Microvirga alba]MBF9235292.1 hypothetical protein [Microvirga alba]
MMVGTFRSPAFFVSFTVATTLKSLDPGDNVHAASNSGCWPHEDPWDVQTHFVFSVNLRQTTLNA